jgi:transcriptional regulator with XRE-family HTH domain
MSTATRTVYSLERPRSEQGKAELKANFVQLRAKGLPYLRIAERLGVAKSTLANWNAELEAQIASAKAMELEALQEEFFVLKEGRIRLLGEQLHRLRQELADRDLSSVPTDKLLELLLKYQAVLKEEFVEVRPLSDPELSRLGSLPSGRDDRWTG